ncbi:MAG: cation diffusion facilitator family transporter [Chitinophagaceae bacterium]
MNKEKQNFRVQQFIVAIAITLFIIKIIAWYITKSVAVLTDALESTVNVVAGFIGLYSLHVAAKPKDEDHPYGHGKAEFVSAAVEGTLIFLAGLIIIYTSVESFIHPKKLEKLDYGIVLVGITGAINFVVGYFAIKQGKKNKSLALEASGKHLQTDTWSTIGIIIGLGLILLTGYVWLDAVVAIVFAFVILYTGYKIIRSSLAGIMDEVDIELLSSLIKLLNNNRRTDWIDLHNLRVIKYGGQLHIDCHMTVPWYLNVHQAHIEIDALTSLIKKEFGDTIEFFVHTDGCLDFSCRICDKQDCYVRKHPFEKKIEWSLKNIISNKKHGIEEMSDV